MLGKLNLIGSVEPHNDDPGQANIWCKSNEAFSLGDETPQTCMESTVYAEGGYMLETHEPRTPARSMPLSAAPVNANTMSAASLPLFLT